MEMAYCVVFASGGVYRPAVRSAESECTGYAHSPYRIQAVGVLDYQPFYRKCGVGVPFGKGYVAAY